MIVCSTWLLVTKFLWKKNSVQKLFWIGDFFFERAGRLTKSNYMYSVEGRLRLWIHVQYFLNASVMSWMDDLLLEFTVLLMGSRYYCGCILVCILSSSITINCLVLQFCFSLLRKSIHTGKTMNSKICHVSDVFILSFINQLPWQNRKITENVKASPQSMYM